MVLFPIINPASMIFRLPKDSLAEQNFPIRNLQPLYELGIERVLPIQRGNDVLGFLGISSDPDENSSVEDEQFLLSLSSQMSHLILTHELSQDLLISKEWDSFNQCASFVLHGLAPFFGAAAARFQCLAQQFLGPARR